MWESIDLPELRVFLLLADELHFGRTAERLELSPSRVSQLVRSLEAKLGTRLVHRTSRRVELTADGQRLRDEAGGVYTELMEVLERAYDAHGSLEGTLRIAVFSGPSGGQRLVDMVAAFEARYPKCSVEIGQLPQDDVFGPLRRGEVNVISTWLPLDEPDVVVGPTLTIEPRVLAVGRDHPLAGRDAVTVEELADYRVARFQELPAAFREAWIPTSTPSGRRIPSVPVGLPDRALTELVLRIEGGEIVHPTVPSSAPFLGPRIVYVPITDLPPLRSALVWRRPARDPKLREFVRIAREVSKTERARRGARRPS
jgi:DNA-binding transcriptional LysR family regulator